MKSKKYFKNRNMKNCGCGHDHFRTIIKNKAHACAKCGAVRILVDSKELSKDEQFKIGNHHMQLRKDKEIKHIKLKEIAEKAEVRKFKKKKPKKAFWTPKFMQKKLNPVIDPSMKGKPVKTEKGTEKK